MIELKGQQAKDFISAFNKSVDEYRDKQGDKTKHDLIHECPSCNNPCNCDNSECECACSDDEV